MNKPFPFKNEERLLLVSGAQSYSDEDVSIILSTFVIHEEVNN